MRLICHHGLPSYKIRGTWTFHVVDVRRMSKKCTKMYNARAQPLICSLTEPFVWWRFLCHCHRGFLKVPYWSTFSYLLKVDLAMDVEKALPRALRKRFIPDRQVIRPNQYHGFKGYWYSPPISAENVQTALNPKKVGVTRKTSSVLLLKTFESGLHSKWIDWVVLFFVVDSTWKIEWPNRGASGNCERDEESNEDNAV